MGSTYRFIADPSEQSEMLEWFCSIREPPTEKLSDCGVVLSFVAHGPRSYSSNGRIDSHSSPVVTVFLPRVRRGSDLDSREVHFLARPDSSFRPRRFAARLSSGVGLNVCFGSKVFAPRDLPNRSRAARSRRLLLLPVFAWAFPRS